MSALCLRMHWHSCGAQEADSDSMERKTYRTIIIAESRNWFAGMTDYDPARDLVLALDYGLHRQIAAQGGEVAYLDHLLDRDVMQANNYLTYDYFRHWHNDAYGRDQLVHQGVPFGFALRVDIWNDLLCYVRFRLCLAQVGQIAHQQMRVGTQIGPLLQALDASGLRYSALPAPTGPMIPSYFFPIFRWMDERVRSTHWKSLVREWMTAVLGTVRGWLDRLPAQRRRHAVYVQEYHPTRQLADALRADARLRVVQGHYRAAGGWRGLLREHVIPIWPTSWRFEAEAERLLQGVEATSAARLVLSNGTDVTDEVRTLIVRRLRPRLATAINELHWVQRYMVQHPLVMMVLVGNLGPIAAVAHRVADQLGIPSFLILNGLLGKASQDESKHATWINAYGESICSHYFAGMDNVECLGDPRMDAYAGCAPRILNRSCPTVTIGASGFNPTDLNSYLAVEFDFLADVLTALCAARSAGLTLHVVIKVRPNGYRTQYEEFVAEYFPNLDCRIEDEIPMHTLLEQTDFYISIYS